MEVNFINNTAGYAGSSLYGQGLCCSNSSSCENFYAIFNISNTEADPSAVASDADNVCLCENDKRKPDCSSGKRSFVTQAFLGEDFQVRLAVVGASLDGVVSTAIRAFFPQDRHDWWYNSTLGVSQTSQVSGHHSCQTFNYSIGTTITQRNVTFTLIPEKSFLKEVTSLTTDVISREYMTITVYLKDCPPGFTLSPDAGKCVCVEALRNAKIECNINNQSILRPANSWIGFINQSGSSPGLIFHQNCPLGYCLPGDVSITLNTSDSQCRPHRTGLLCGKCEEGYSLTLGDGKCTKCSSVYLLMLLAFAAAGLLLVTILFALNLTVTEGSINGLIFYANVMGMSDSICTPPEAGPICMFLSWVNLDLGVSVCLYDGMDGYADVWLQFLFPVYIWMIMLVIIQLYSRIPMLANRLGGDNAVKVLATLLLLSYTKLQRTVITILSFTRLEYPDGAVHYVWLYDANVEFFKGKHLYLGIAGILVLVFLIVPYTLCLAFFQQLQACSGHRLFQWVNKLKPVFDAYAGPYKDKYRFWTGMLLVVRTLLIILFTVNTAGSVDVNLLIISIAACFLLVVSANAVYKTWLWNFVESFFYVQLIAFAAGAAYARYNQGSIADVTNTSVGLALFVFLVVVGYHAVHLVPSFKKWHYFRKGYADIAEEAHERPLTHERIIS